jgi:sugar phosphate isomerase/epimerase
MKYIQCLRYLGYSLALSLLTMSTVSAQKVEKKTGWKLGAQSYSFRLFTLAEALDKLDTCQLDFVEMYNGQVIGNGHDQKVNFQDASQIPIIAQLLQSKKKTVSAFGVVTPKGVQEWKAMFEFAKGLNIGIINAEPLVEELDLVAQLATEYKIKVALHNHPKPTKYWNIDEVLGWLEGKGDYLGICADIGHWVRSGLDPVACLQKSKGKLFSMHFKDLHEASRQGHDVIWGTGVCKIEEVVKELKAQKFKGVISAEYEYHWEHNTLDIKNSVSNLRKMSSK